MTDVSAATDADHPSPLRASQPDAVVVQLPSRLESVSVARSTVRTAWADLSRDILDDLALVVTELVANAVEHGRPDIVLHLRRPAEGVEVAVLDHGLTMPPTAVDMPTPIATSGRGLAIVDRLATAWGVTPSDRNDGKTVWAQLAC